MRSSDAWALNTIAFEYLLSALFLVKNFCPGVGDLEGEYIIIKAIIWK